MSWTKRQLVMQAFEELGYTSYAFDLEPEQLQLALRRLDSMMAQWNYSGVRLGYPLPSTPQDSDLDTDTGVSDTAVEAIYLNLALRIAPTIGKTVQPETKVSARRSWGRLLSIAAMPQERQLPGTLPAGAGNKKHDRPFIERPTEDFDLVGGGAIEFD